MKKLILALMSVACLAFSVPATSVPAAADTVTTQVVHGPYGGTTVRKFRRHGRYVTSSVTRRRFGGGYTRVVHGVYGGTTVRRVNRHGRFTTSVVTRTAPNGMSCRTVSRSTRTGFGVARMSRRMCR